MKLRKFLKQTVITVMCIALLIVAGCNNSGNSKETTGVTEQPDTTGSTDVTTESVQGSGYDLSIVCDNIKLNGEKIPFPCTLNELGDAYTFDGEYTPGPMEKEYVAYLLYNGQNIAMVFIKEEGGEKDIGRDSKIFYIILTSRHTDISFNGVTLESNMEEIVEQLGQPTAEYDAEKDDDVKLYKYIKDEDNYFSISYNFKKEKIESIYLMWRD